MNTENKVFQNGEAIIDEAKPSVLLLIPRGAWIALMLLFTFYSPDIYLFWFLLALPSLISIARTFFYQRLYVTSTMIYGRLNILKKEEMTSPLKQVANVNISYGILGRILGYGTISVTTSSGIFKYKNINRPEKFRDSVMKAIQNVSKTE